MKEAEYNNLEKYIHQEMNNDEKNAFELEMKKDKQLAEMHKVYNELPVLLGNVSKDVSFRQKMKTVQADYITDNSPKKSNSRWIGVIIGILVLSFLVWKLAFPTKTTEVLPVEEQIYAYLENSDKPNSEIQRNIADLDQSEARYLSAFQLYEKEDYSSAIIVLDSIQAESKAYIDALELKGFSQYKSKQYEAAITTYNTYLAQENAQKDVVLWYQAFAFLKNNQPDLAKENLQEIINQDYSNAKDAQEVLKLL